MNCRRSMLLSDKVKRLDEVFSRYIRLRDTHSGTGQCITCGASIRFETCDAGHYISRRHMATRWNEENVHAQCVECNRYRYGNLQRYRRSLVLMYGAELVAELERRKNLAVHVDGMMLDKLIKYFQQKTKLL